jgi:hypothetical protein
VKGTNVKYDRKYDYWDGTWADCIGRRYASWGTEIYECESRDSAGLNMRHVDTGEVKNISERAIGRTFHEVKPSPGADKLLAFALAHPAVKLAGVVRHLVDIGFEKRADDDRQRPARRPEDYRARAEKIDGAQALIDYNAEHQIWLSAALQRLERLGFVDKAGAVTDAGRSYVEHLRALVST